MIRITFLLARASVVAFVLFRVLKETGPWATGVLAVLYAGWELDRYMREQSLANLREQRRYTPEIE